MPTITRPTRANSLDRILRTLRATMRTRGLPRPDRLVISTRSRSVHIEFTTGTAPDRLAALLLWSATLHAVTLAWTWTTTGLHVATTGRTSGGITLGAATTTDLTGLAARVLTGGTVVELAGSLRLPLWETETVSHEELAHLVMASRAKRSALRVPAGAGVAA